MKKLSITIICFLCCFAVIAQVEHKMWKVKSQDYNNYRGEWEGWPSSWTYFDYDERPTLRVTYLGASAPHYLVELKWQSKNHSFMLTYEGYDKEQGWFEYLDEDGDSFTITGSSLNQLAKNGWPSGKKVQVYIWLNSEDYALVLE